MDSTQEPMVEPPPLVRIADYKVRQLQVIFMITLGVCLVLALCLLGLSLLGVGRGPYLQDMGRTLELALTLLTIICYGFGFFVAHRYSARGLRVFALMGVFLLVVIGVGIVLYIIILIFSSNNESKKRPTYSTLMISITLGISIPYFIATVGAVVLAFILARFIDGGKHAASQRI